MSEPKLAYSYIRFSTPEQAKGDSLRRQMEMAKDWCARNKVRLDESLRLQDLGKSAYTGEHRKNPDRNALAAFLKLIEAGRIPEGSFLIVESLDRLSREDIKPALSLLLSLSDHVQIVQLHPVEQIYGKAVEPMALMLAIMELSRGHSESKMKSVRVRGNWDNERRQARTEKTPLPGRVPAWIERGEKDNRYHLIPHAAKTVQLVFNLAKKGYGTIRIVRELVERKVEPFGRTDRWNTSYVRRILESPAVYGLHQCYTVDGKPEGEPIPGYFPPAVSEDTFFAVQALRSKPRQRGRQGNRVYLFNRLLRDAIDGDRFHAHLNTKTRRQVFIPSETKRGWTKTATSFPIEPFEKALLKHLNEIDARDIIPDTNHEADNVLSLTGQLLAVESKIAELEQELMNGDVATLAKMLRKLESDKKTLSEKLATARQKAANPQTEAWANCKSLISVVEESLCQEETRLKLRSVLERTISEIACIFAAHRKWRLAYVQVRFVDSLYVRDVWIMYHGKYNTFQGVKDAYLYSDTQRLQDIDTNDPATSANELIGFLKDQADLYDKEHLARWPKR